LSSLGHSVTTYTSNTASGINAGLSGKDLVLIPEQERGNLISALNSPARSAYRSFVNNGGGLIIQGFSGRADDFLNGVFGFNDSEVTAGSYGSPITFFRQSAANSTEFSNDASSLPWNDGTNALLESSLPSGSRSIYENGNNSAVAVMPYGLGKIVFTGWDWYNARPTGSQDGGWLTVLDSAVDEVTPTFTVDNESITEGTGGSRSLTFDIRRSSSSSVQTSVVYATANGSALAGQDYSSRSGRVYFNPGVTRVTVSAPSSPTISMKMTSPFS
jgi:hypothetical protein